MSALVVLDPDEVALLIYGGHLPCEGQIDRLIGLPSGAFGSFVLMLGERHVVEQRPEVS